MRPPGALTLRMVPDGAGMALVPADLSRAGIAVDALMTGRPLTEVRRLLPLVFGLCRAVQETALSLALGDDLPAGQPAPLALRRDLLRDHLVKLHLHLPKALGLAPLPVPQDWMVDGAGVLQSAFGPGGLPTAEGFSRWMAAGDGLAPVVQAVARAFDRVGVTTDLPPLSLEAPFAGRPVENTLALRHDGHPLLRHVRQHHGHGPLAHVVARLIDLSDLAQGRLPAPQCLPDGTAAVPCSRGLCLLRIRSVGGIVTAFYRRTPTDHLLQPGGLLQASLGRLPPGRAGLAPLLAEILDPCVPLSLKGMADA